MKYNTRINLAAFFMIALIMCNFNTAHARITPQLPFVTLTSEQSLHLLKHNLNLNGLKLLANFTTQKNVTYCGIASAVMVLNARGIPAPLDPEHPPFRYFTQDNIFNEKVLTLIKPEQVDKTGISLLTLSQVLERFDLKVRAVFADQLSEEQFKKQLIQALANQDSVIVNFLRTALHQDGGGHHSPIAAYDAVSDRFLILDVARYKYDSYWVKSHDLWLAVNTKDGARYRGFIVVKH